MDLTVQVLCNIVLYSNRLNFHHQSHLQLGVVFALALSRHSFEASLVAQAVKRLPTVQETQVSSLGREVPLEKEMESFFLELFLL